MIISKSKKNIQETNPELTNNIRKIWNGLDFSKVEDINGVNSLVLDFRGKINNLGVNFIVPNEYEELHKIVNAGYCDENGDFNGTRCFAEIENVLRKVFGII